MSDDKRSNLIDLPNLEKLHEDDKFLAVNAYQEQMDYLFDKGSVIVEMGEGNVKSFWCYAHDDQQAATANVEFRFKANLTPKKSAKALVDAMYKTILDLHDIKRGNKGFVREGVEKLVGELFPDYKNGDKTFCHELSITIERIGTLFFIEEHEIRAPLDKKIWLEAFTKPRVITLLKDRKTRSY